MAGEDEVYTYIRQCFQEFEDVTQYTAQRTDYVTQISISESGRGLNERCRKIL